MVIQTDDKGANRVTNTKVLALRLTKARDISVTQIQKTASNTRISK